MNPNGNGQQPKIDNPLMVMSPGEQVLGEIKRHPFGLVGIYIMSAIVVIVMLVACILAPTYLTGLSGQAKSLIWFGALLGTVIVLLFLYVTAAIYNGNRWIITSDSITQVSQTGLFRKQTSQLSLANLEDVTFEQNSVVQQMVGFGLLKVETAGEHSKFSFPFCPKPADWARNIIKAHEDFISAHPEEQHTAQQALATPPQQYGQWQQPPYNNQYGEPQGQWPQQPPQYAPQNQQWQQAQPQNYSQEPSQAAQQPWQQDGADVGGQSQAQPEGRPQQYAQYSTRSDVPPAADTEGDGGVQE